ncbi:hypothetical protein [Streptomyces halobius]|uniref:Uncharacterized protein n=1 Tax=Streptomyces halobius TaxID=2879846 RepID=A0ABY4MM35_9ACTN|nr:hypothetical protein [Streptomyces halobius]UQA97481.1 hypothetical protein K9S39_41560 [Streptomyces halobius]
MTTSNTQEIPTLIRWTAAASPLYEYVSAAAKDLAELGMHIAYTWDAGPAPEMK